MSPDASTSTKAPVNVAAKVELFVENSVR